MSKLLAEEKVAGGVRSYAEDLNGMIYAVDSRDTFDVGLETMVFKAKKTAHGYKVAHWTALYQRQYPNMDVMYVGHDEITGNLENYLHLLRV